MKKINQNEMKKINGGGIKVGVVMALGALASFIIGIIDGYIRPIACK